MIPKNVTFKRPAILPVTPAARRSIVVIVRLFVDSLYGTVMAQPQPPGQKGGLLQLTDLSPSAHSLS